MKSPTVSAGTSVQAQPLMKPLRVLEKQNRTLLFTDFIKTYDSVKRQCGTSVLVEFRRPTEFVKVIKMCRNKIYRK
jgi:hypothetical protein